LAKDIWPKTFGRRHLAEDIWPKRHLVEDIWPKHIRLTQCL
jgi:hypothetical protein